MLRNRYLLGALAASWLLGGCTVYAPTVPSTPLVEKGQVELTAGVRGLNVLELGAAWSPVPHLLLTSEAAFRGGDGSSTDNNNVTTTYEDYHRQASVGIGYYRAPTGQSRLYLAVVGGVGWASVNLHDIDFAVPSIFLPIPLPYVAGFYEAHYRRYYGQVYLAQRQSERLTNGFSVRGTWVDYTQLVVDGQPFAPANRFFLEPNFFLRFGRGPLQGYFTLGLSLPTARDRANSTESKTAPISGLIGVGVVFRPHLLGAGRQRAGL